MINSNFSFKRKTFVKDLLNPNMCLINTGALEFESFDCFARTVLKDKKLDIRKAEKLIVPVTNGTQVDFLLQLNSKARPFLIIKLNDWSFDTLNAFHKTNNTAVLIDVENIQDFKKSLAEHPCKNFCDFAVSTFGYFRTSINAEQIDDIVYIATDPFFEFPFFCTADISIDYKSFNDKPISSMDAIEWHCNILAYNMINRSAAISWKKYGYKCDDCDNDCKDGNCNGNCSNNGKCTCGDKTYKYDILHTGRPKRVFISDDYKMYVDTKEFKKSELDLYKEYDTNEISIKEIDPIRACYDAKLSKTCGINELSLISYYQNYLVYDNVAMVPYITYVFDRTIKGGRA